MKKWSTSKRGPSPLLSGLPKAPASSSTMCCCASHPSSSSAHSSPGSWPSTLKPRRSARSRSPKRKQTLLRLGAPSPTDSVTYRASKVATAPIATARPAHGLHGGHANLCFHTVEGETTQLGLENSTWKSALDESQLRKHPTLHWKLSTWSKNHVSYTDCAYSCTQIVRWVYHISWAFFFFPLDFVFHQSVKLYVHIVLDTLSNPHCWKDQASLQSISLASVLAVRHTASTPPVLQELCILVHEAAATCDVFLRCTHLIGPSCIGHPALRESVSEMLQHCTSIPCTLQVNHWLRYEHMKHNDQITCFILFHMTFLFNVSFISVDGNYCECKVPQLTKAGAVAVSVCASVCSLCHTIEAPRYLNKLFKSCPGLTCYFVFWPRLHETWMWAFAK